MKNWQELEKFTAPYPRLAIIGGYWGDEGKAKEVDIFSAFYDIVERFGGGNNAGHSVKVDEQGFAFHLIPSGFVRGKIGVLGPGVVYDPKAFAEEWQENKAKLSHAAPPIWIDERCPLWTPYHSLFEKYLEDTRGKDKIGTTGKAIGPLKSFYDLREGAVTLYLKDEERLLKALTRLRDILEPILSKLGVTVPLPQTVVGEMIKLAQDAGILPLIIDTRAYVLEAITQENAHVLFEGAQATGLSIDAGTWPHSTVTSSIAAGIAAGTLLPPRALSGTILVIKLFPTRVGGGPFPSEYSTREAIQHFADDNKILFKDETARERFLTERLALCRSGKATPAEIGEYIMVKAREIGVSTGRGRSPGRPDLAWARYAIEVNDPIGLALNGLDIASGFPQIEVVSGYIYQDEFLPQGKVPALDLGEVKPVINTWSGWEEDITGITAWEDLPEKAQKFVEGLESILERPIVLIGTGPRREDFIFRPPDGRYGTFF